MISGDNSSKKPGTPIPGYRMITQMTMVETHSTKHLSFFDISSGVQSVKIVLQSYLCGTKTHRCCRTDDQLLM